MKIIKMFLRLLSVLVGVFFYFTYFFWRDLFKAFFLELKVASSERARRLEDAVVEKVRRDQSF